MIMAGMKIDLKSQVSQPSPAAAFSLMLGGMAQKDIAELEIDTLFPYPNQPFKPYPEDKLLELAEDIKANGILSPVIVRPLDEGYQILAGHNRVSAGRIAGLLAIPCIVKDFDDDMAQLVLVNTNLNQRQELLPSEKAFAYKMQMDAMKRQGQRTDLTSGRFDWNSGALTLAQFDPKLERRTSAQFEPKSKAADHIAKTANTSAAQVKRYIRLTYLAQPLLDMVDAGTIPVAAGVELSWLNRETQMRLTEYLAVYHVKIDMAKAELLRQSSQDGTLTRGELSELLSPATKPAKEKTSLKFQSSELARYFPDRKPKEIEREILKILEQHFSTQSDNS